MIHALRPLLGHSLKFRGHEAVLRDLIQDSACVVLETRHRDVQATAYGEGHRRVPRLIELDMNQAELRHELWNAVSAMITIDQPNTPDSI